MSGHTPGPWTVNGAGGTFSKIARLAPAGVIVSANSVPQTGQEIPNARLIAAAPEMLEQLLRGSIPSSDGPCWCDPGFMGLASGHHAQYCRTTRAVVAKAEGK